MCQANNTEPNLADDEGGSFRSILREQHDSGEVTIVHKWRLFEIHLQVRISWVYVAALPLIWEVVKGLTTTHKETSVTSRVVAPAIDAISASIVLAVF